jgi:hypothetical protein
MQLKLNMTSEWLNPQVRGKTSVRRSISTITLEIIPIKFKIIYLEFLRKDKSLM